MVEGARVGHGSDVWLKMAGDVEDLECGDAVCPCGGVPAGATLDCCCGPLVRGERLAETAEELMRSRYTAYAVAAGDHLFRTWHARTRPYDVEPDPWVRWDGLELLDVVGGGAQDTTGVVEFRASWVAGEGATHQRGELHERSQFVRRAGRWMYVEGEQPAPTGRR